MPDGTDMATAMVPAAPAAAIAAERLLQASPAIAIGSAERTKSGNARSVPPSGEMKRSDEAKPAPTPTRAICIIFVAVPPLERLGAGRGNYPRPCPNQIDPARSGRAALCHELNVYLIT